MRNLENYQEVYFPGAASLVSLRKKSSLNKTSLLCTDEVSANSRRAL